MRLSSLIVVTAAAAFACTPPAGHGAVLDTQITSLPSSVKQGGTLHLEALSVGGTACSLTVRYADGKVQALGTKRMAVFRVAWTWRVPAGAASGPAHVAVSCGTAGRAQTSFTVARQLQPARVVVAKSGVSQVGGEASYGIVLVNRSPAADAVDVQVDVALLDRARRVVGTDTVAIAAIPAGGTYYLGGTRGAANVAAVRPTVRVGSSKPKSIRAPLVGAIRVTPHDADGGAYVDGQVANLGGATLSSLATVSTVFLDGSGRVIGGAVTLVPSALAPGASASFEISTPVAASAIASVLGSVEPRY